jgi:hypothetical protein
MLDARDAVLVSQPMRVVLTNRPVSKISKISCKWGRKVVSVHTMLPDEQ